MNLTTLNSFNVGMPHNRHCIITKWPHDTVSASPDWDIAARGLHLTSRNRLPPWWPAHCRVKLTAFIQRLNLNLPSSAFWRVTGIYNLSTHALRARHEASVLIPWMTGLEHRLTCNRLAFTNIPLLYSESFSNSVYWQQAGRNKKLSSWRTSPWANYSSQTKKCLYKTLCAGPFTSK